MPINQLPENFVYHSDCMVPWTDFVSAEEILEVEQYATDHFGELADAIVAANPQATFTPEDLFMFAEDGAFEEVFPARAEEKYNLEKTLAVQAYKDRGAGDCSDCTHESLDEPWKAVE